jgi:hypothetical protein
MKWLKMDCDAQENLDMRKLVEDWGWDWYGRYWAILGKIGMLVTEKCQTFALQTNNGCPFPVKLLANDLSTNVERLSDFCRYLADNRLIDPEAWNDKKLIYVPKLRERADEYTRKLLTKSGDSPENVHVEEEVEVDKKKKEKRKKTAAPFIPPTEAEVVEYFTTNGFSAAAGRQAFQYYAAAEWHDSKGNGVRNWKQKMIAVWFKEENKNGTNQRSGGAGTREVFTPEGNQRIADQVRAIRAARERGGDNPGG